MHVIPKVSRCSTSACCVAFCHVVLMHCTHALCYALLLVVLLEGQRAFLHRGYAYGCPAKGTTYARLTNTRYSY